MSAPITLKVGPKIWGKLSSLKRARSLIVDKDVTWDELMEYLVEESLPFLVLEMSKKLQGKYPESMEQFKERLAYMKGVLDGIGVTTEEAFKGMEQAAEQLRSLIKPRERGNDVV